MFAGNNSLYDVGYFLKEVDNLLLLGAFEFQFAYLFELWACGSENGFNVFLHF